MQITRKGAGTVISAIRPPCVLPFKTASSLVRRNSVPKPTAGMVVRRIENFLE